MADDPGTERFAAMGTRVELHRFDGRADDALQAARRAIEAVDDALTIHRPSPATAMNEALLAGRAAVLDDDLLFDAVLAAAQGNADTYGLFDIAADTRTGASWAMVTLDAHTRRIAAERPVALDFGGLGKGFALDRAIAVLREAGVASALLTLGESSVAVLGEHPLGGGWPFAIPHPDDPEQELLTLELVDQALSVSATVGAGTRAPERAATTRPHTGTAVTAPLCAVAVEPSGTLAEVMSTALIAADDSAAARLLRGRPTSRFRFDLGPTHRPNPARILAA
ncbi:FAD:protein FMN transferase [Sphingomonas desiccabilis]|uniref:FAD:protein FMN transferase n=1 Tax=Sphingomonas desiccabilis TaxID=429134 RepID=A0A4Q2IUN1_9SPHN|nr:FAD:protein FMN transferase [Sphingomonas desiccabilis]MBB3909657.1 thiamine biosynthesis lipoprotein ApbE [Sphingomonas desiccabilis]RXZ34359.1 FAD:protein FMN transferase [Sphingomonas desiccabilis]